VCKACRDHVSGYVALPSRRAEARHVDVQAHPAYLVGREEPVLDPVAERVLVHRIAEVTKRVDIVPADRCGRESDLYGFVEVRQDVAPLGGRAGAAPVALIDDDQVEVTHQN
jgi:hypothetical protein